MINETHEVMKVLRIRMGTTIPQVVSRVSNQVMMLNRIQIRKRNLKFHQNNQDADARSQIGQCLQSMVCYSWCDLCPSFTSYRYR